MKIIAVFCATIVAVAARGFVDQQSSSAAPVLPDSNGQRTLNTDGGEPAKVRLFPDGDAKEPQVNNDENENEEKKLFPDQAGAPKVSNANPNVLKNDEEEKSSDEKPVQTSGVHGPPRFRRPRPAR